MPDSDFPSIVPPPPPSHDPVTPEKKVKKDRVGWAVPIVGVAIIASLWFVTREGPTREYPSRTSPTPAEVVAEAPGQATLDAMTATLVQALDSDNEKLVRGTIADIQEKTGCLAVAGGRVIVDPTDKAEVAEEASKRAQYEDSLEAQGLVVGHHEFKTPEGLVHQVIGFECN